MFARRWKLFVIGLAAPVVAFAAQPPTPAPDALDLSAIVQMAASSAAGTSDGEQADFATVTKDMESQSGLFTLWSYPAGAKDKDPEKLLCEIPASLLGQQIMLSTSVAGGGFFTGFPLNEHVVMWKLHGDQLLLIEPETLFVTPPGKEVADVVRRTYPDRIRAAVPVVTKSPVGNPVFDLGALLKSEFADIGWMSMGFGPFGGSGSGGINPQLSTWEKKKVFELNAEFTVALALRRSSPPGSFDKKLVHYSFWKLPDTGYTPRVADDRVGYFVTANLDWSKPNTERELFNRFVNRWQLEKRDPSLDLCEPKQPIVFYIEKTVPVKYRRAVREGILDWNKAFEKIGFVNAIEVRQQTDDNEWADLDPEDMRYAFIRWIVSGSPFAMGPSRVNPFTGQIYDGDIIFDDSMVRFLADEVERTFPGEVARQKFSDPARAAMLRDNPRWQRVLGVDTTFQVGEQSEDRVVLERRAREHLQRHGRCGCTYATGMRRQLRLAHTWLAKQPLEIRDEVVHQVIKEVVTHEVGHVLGLRHNFKASSIYSLDQIKQRRTTGEPLAGSVMDYNPVLIFAGDDQRDDLKQLSFVTPTIGPYDYWAIEYGYRPFDGSYEASAELDESDAQPSEADEPARPDTPIAVTADVSLDALPADVLAKMPPEAKAMLENPAIKAMLAEAAAGRQSGGAAPPPAARMQAPTVRAPVAGETAMLRDIAGRSNEPELAFLSDEDASGFGTDPATARFDAAADPIEWAAARIELVDKRLADILEWSVKDGEAWYHLRGDFISLWTEKAFVLDYVGKYIGGQYYSRNHRGDANGQTPFVLVDADTQRRALQFTADHLFSADYFATDPEVYNHLAIPRWWHAGTNVSMAGDFPVHDMVAMFQWWNLFDRLMPNTLRRIYDAELKTAATDRFTVAEYIQTLQAVCWDDATSVNRLTNGDWSDTQPFLTSKRRTLQREYLGLVEPLVRERPGRVLQPDLHAMMTLAVRDLGDQLGAVLKQSDELDFASRAHLTACKSRIDRMLSAELGEYTPAPAMMFMFGQEANGQ